MAGESGLDLWPVLSVHLGNICFATWNKVGRDENRIRLPASTGVFSTCYGGWLWSGTRTCLVRPLRSFREQSICSFLSIALSSCSRRLMSGANMSIIGRVAVKRFSTRITSESVLRGLLLVGFQVTAHLPRIEFPTVSEYALVLV